MTLGSFRIFFFLMIQRPSTSTLFPYTTLFRSNALLVLERALVVMIGQAPAGLDAEKRSAVGPQCHVWYACKIHRHPPATRRIDIGEFPPSDINQLEDDRTGQFVL